MWRTVFIAFGIMAIIIGVECLVIESASVYAAGETKAAAFINPASSPATQMREWRPKEWFPWALLSSGAITVLYTFALPQRWGRAVA